jgi:excisionase family DNA binding protein
MLFNYSLGGKMMEIYTIKEAAELLKVHDRTIRRYIKSGELKAANLGSEEQPNWRITEEDIKEFLDSKKRLLKKDE